MTAPPLRVMPLGDSITAGWDESGSNRGGYRAALWERLVAQDGRRVEFVGSRTGGVPPGVPDLAHEGHGGYRIDQVRALLDWSLWTYVPDVVLLHLGSNDIGQGFFDGASARLAELAARVCQDRPEAQLLLASITPMPAMQTYVDAYNAQIPGIVAGLEAVGCRAAYVDMAAVITPGDLFDGVHPSLAGYGRMADVWYGPVAAADDARSHGV